MGRLFDSSEDEQDDVDAERFKIKPQFEGRAGEKVSEPITIIQSSKSPLMLFQKYVTRGFA